MAIINVHTIVLICVPYAKQNCTVKTRISNHHFFKSENSVEETGWQECSQRMNHKMTGRQRVIRSTGLKAVQGQKGNQRALSPRAAVALLSADLGICWHILESESHQEISVDIPTFISTVLLAHNFGNDLLWWLTATFSPSKLSSHSSFPYNNTFLTHYELTKFSLH